MGFLQTMRRWKSQREKQRREHSILNQCGCVTYCPECKEPLNDQALWDYVGDEGMGVYRCNICGHSSKWHFGIAPAPICLSTNCCRPSFPIRTIVKKNVDF